ncbi:MAG: hypothetical protein QOJ95_826 [Mycobacterium sp.]|jgi:hypothetical protein|nr:hypothetical protein [Mycobacterium sp.]
MTDRAIYLVRHGQTALNAEGLRPAESLAPALASRAPSGSTTGVDHHPPQPMRSPGRCSFQRPRLRQLDRPTQD